MPEVNQFAPVVTAILLCRNEVHEIEGCLRSLLCQASPPGGFEILVVDGMSDDGTREILRRWDAGGRRCGLEDNGTTRPHDGQFVLSGQWSVVSGRIIRLIDNPDRIVSAGLNAAIRAARGRIVVRMDAHTEYAPDYIQLCVEVLERTGADNVGGPARTKAESYLGRAIAAAYHSPFSVGGARFHDVDYEGWVDTVTYGCWRREAFEKFGYFDEELVRNQDDEHNLRIARGGGKIYQSPKIKSWYRPRGSLKALAKQYMQYGYWKVRVIQKHKFPASWRHLVPGAFVLILGALFLLSTSCFLLLMLTTDHRPLTTDLCLLSSGLLGLLLATYSLALITASLITVAKAGWKLFPVLPAVFVCYHFGYGLGFIRGVWDFVIRRCNSSPKFHALTR